MQKDIINAIMKEHIMQCQTGISGVNGVNEEEIRTNKLLKMKS